MTNPLQYNLRHLLVAMLVIAIGSAALAPWIRDLTRGQWLRLASGVGLAGVILACVLLLGSYQYLRARRQLGSVGWEITGALRGQGTTAARFLPYYFLISAAVSALLLSAFEFLADNKQLVVFQLFQSFNIGMGAGMGLLGIRCPLDRVLLGENGILASNAFIPWDKVWYSWVKDGKPTPILLRTSSWAIFELQVPLESEESVADFLQGRARTWDHPWRPKRA